MPSISTIYGVTVIPKPPCQARDGVTKIGEREAAPCGAIRGAEMELQGTVNW